MTRNTSAAFKSVLALMLFVPGGALLAQTSTAFLPGAGQADVSVSYVYQGFRDFKAGTVDGTLPHTLSQNSILVSGDYGLSNRVAFDLWTGYTRSSLLGSEGGVSQGAGDTTLGLRFTLYKWEHVTLTGRTDAIIAGSYPLSSLGPFAAGLGANGFLGSLLIGITGPRGLSFDIENGYKEYGSPVPDYLFDSVTVNQQVFKRWYYLAGFEEERAVSGLQLNSPTFVPSQFPQLKETEGDIIAGFGFTEGNGLSYGFNYGHWVHGTNSGKRAIYAFTLGYHLGGHHPHL